MNNQIEQFLRDILIQDLDHKQIREKAVDLLLLYKQAKKHVFPCGVECTENEYKEIVNILRSGFITGIKHIRSLTNCGLKEAKDIADQIVADEKIEKKFSN